MQKESFAVLAMLLVVSVSATAGNASVSIGGGNSFNNSGLISVSQGSTISNSDVAIEEQLNSRLAKAANMLANPSATIEQKKQQQK